MDRSRVKFGGQTSEEAAGNLTLASLIRDRRGDPALSAWEEGFLTDIERLLRSHDGRVTLTDKQFDRVFLIFEKLEGLEVAPVDELPEAGGHEDDDPDIRPAPGFNISDQTYASKSASPINGQRPFRKS